MSEDISPMRQQYLDLKAQHPHAILLFRLGDFYEAFDDDAEVVARELDIVLTGRGTKNRVPMAGVPHHAVDSYVAKLVERGYHVVIAEQMEPPGKKLVRREIVKVLTPGTVDAPAMLDQRMNNYLMHMAAGRAGIRGHYHRRIRRDSVRLRFGQRANSGSGGLGRIGTTPPA
jgi:DNA mismatch repair protein MutS